MKVKKKYLTFILVIILCANVFIPVFSAENNSTIYIHSADELISLSKKCALDTWSKEKTIVLTGDIDLTGKNFVPVPLFGGTFDGHGYTIRGFEINGSTSVTGVFCNVQEGAVIKQLNVIGAVTPSGSQKIIGGITGINRGKIIDCSFSGTVIGDSSIGGIAGINEATGEIYNCYVNGMILGEHFTGGIAGQNLGSITGSTNNSEINTVNEDPKISFEKLQEKLQNYLKDPNFTENINASTDTGGVTGYSTGLILSCINNGTVGYPHVGYNVGGIAGRSSGHLNNCKNYGKIYGRKDIGGIAGQMTPDIILKFSNDTIADLETELDKLNILVNNAINDADDSTYTVSSRMRKISDYAGSAKDNAQKLTNQTTDWIDANISEINHASEIVADTLNRIEPIVKQFEDISDSIAQGLEKMEAGFREMNWVIDYGRDALSDLQLAIDDLKAANAAAKKGISKIQNDLSALEDAVIIEDEVKINKAGKQLKYSILELADTLRDINIARNDLAEILENIKGLGNLFTQKDEIIAYLKEMENVFNSAIETLYSIGKNIATISVNWNAASKCFKNISSRLSDLIEAFKRLNAAFSHISDAMSETKFAARQTKNAVDNFADSTKILKAAAEQTSDALNSIHDLTTDLSNNKPIQFAQLESDYRNTSDALYSAMSGLNEELDLLNGDITSASDKLISDIRAINAQFKAVTNLFFNAISDISMKDLSEFAEDTSDENINNTTTGKALSCLNDGKVDGDVNVGGITGNMAIEYDLDPEDDIIRDGKNSFNFKFEAKAIVQSCISRGDISSKKDCAGGIAGRMYLGTIVNSEGYGSVMSENGNYIGGIAGRSSSTIRNSYAKCTLSGKKYIGGIVGFGSTVSNCYTLVKIESYTQNAGAISGDVDGTFLDNFFVSDILAGIDRFSYVGKAEPISYDTLINVKDIPDQFKKFTLTFVAEDTVLKTLDFNYDDCLDATVFPQLPSKDGYYATWSKEILNNLTFDEKIEAIYNRYVTVLASEQLRPIGQSVILVEGLFTDKSNLNISEQSTDQTNLKGISERWLLSVTDDGQATYTVRYLAPNNQKHDIAIFVKKGDIWVKASTKMIGNYYAFTIESNEAEIAVVSKSASYSVILMLLTIVILVLIILVIILIKRKRRKQAALSNDSDEWAF